MKLLRLRTIRWVIARTCTPIEPNPDQRIIASCGVGLERVGESCHVKCGVRKRQRFNGEAVNNKEKALIGVLPVTEQLVQSLHITPCIMFGNIRRYFKQFRQLYTATSLLPLG